MKRLEDLQNKKAEPQKVERPEPQPAETKFASVYESLSEKPEGDKRQYGLWVVAVGSVAFLLFALSFLFTKERSGVIQKLSYKILKKSFTKLKPGRGKIFYLNLIATSSEIPAT